MNAYHSLDPSMDKIIVDSSPPIFYIYKGKYKSTWKFFYESSTRNHDIKITGVRMIKDTRYDGKVGKGKERERETREEKMVGCKSLR